MYVYLYKTLPELVSRVAVLLYTAISNYVTCSFSPSLPALGGVTIFYFAQSNRYIVASIGCLIFSQVDSGYALYRSTTN